MDGLKQVSCVGLALLSLVTNSACGDSKSSVGVTPAESPPAVVRTAGPTTAPSSPSASLEPTEPTQLKRNDPRQLKPTDPPQLKIGVTFVGKRSKFTIRSAKLGGSAADYEPGTVWLSADVRICNTGTDALSTPSWSMWLLKTEDDYEVKPADITPEPRQPALPYDSEVARGDCVRGWLTFAPPRTSVMKEIRLVEDEIDGTGSVIASWQAG